MGSILGLSPREFLERLLLMAVIFILSFLVSYGLIWMLLYGIKSALEAS